MGPVRNGQYGSATVRLVVARCEVVYTGHLTAVLPEAVRLLMFKSDGSVLVHDDSGGFKPLNRSRRVFRPSWLLRPTQVRVGFDRLERAEPKTLVEGASAWVDMEDTKR